MDSRDRKKEQSSEPVCNLKYQNRGEIPSDVLGSYTGMSRDGGRPIQDADDL